jgi:hypothetical protein
MSENIHNPKMSENASCWDFTKLLLGLDTAAIGAVIYGQEHMLKAASSRWLLTTSVVFFVIALWTCIRCFNHLIDLEVIQRQEAELSQADANARSALRIQANDKRKEWWRYAAGAIYCFGLGIICAVCFFFWNLWIPTK